MSKTTLENGGVGGVEDGDGNGGYVKKTRMVMVVIMLRRWA